MLYAVLSAQFPPKNLKRNGKSRDSTVDMSHLVMYDTAVACHLHVGTVGFVLVSGRSDAVERHLWR